MIPTDVSAVDIYRYLDMRGKTAKISANREFALLSHVFSYAIRWGSIKLNPCTGVKKFSENKRSRNVTDEEFLAVMTAATYPIKHAMNLTYMMGLRPTEVLKLKRSNIRDEGLYVDITKTKKGAKGKIVEWSEPLKKLVTELSHMNKYKISHLDFLLCNRVGQPYTPDGFTTMWKRHMNKCVEKGLIKEPFQFRDIRHKSATDIEKMYSREDARKLLGHTSQTTTARYIDGVNVVKGITK
jgi:integrase